MPQLRWTLLCLGVLFVILLAWIERRRQRRQGFEEHSPGVDREPAAEASPAPMFREPSLTLPEMRARDPAPPQELPVVEIDAESLKARRVDADESRIEPPTLSLPVLESGPVGPKSRGAEPNLGGIDLVNLDRTDEYTKSVGSLNVPRLDTPAPQLGTLLAEALDTPTPKLGTLPAQALNAPPHRPGVRSTRLADLDPPVGDSDTRAFNEAVFGDLSLEANPREPDFSDEDAISEGAVADGAPGEGMSADADTAGAPRASTSTAAQFTAADVTPIPDPIVEWPPDDQRRVVAVRLVAPAPERLAGRALRLALASEGFVLGKFQIFHKPDESGRAVLSVANLSKPGTFDLETMDLQRYGGLSLFAVLPGPRPPLKTFEDLLTTARNLNERLQGALQDERGGPLTPTRIASLRESLAAETTS